MDGSKRNVSKNYTDEPERCYAATKFPKFRNRIYSTSSISSSKVCYIEKDYIVIYTKIVMKIQLFINTYINTV